MGYAPQPLPSCGATIKTLRGAWPCRCMSRAADDRSDRVHRSAGRRRMWWTKGSRGRCGRTERSTRHRMEQRLLGQIHRRSRRSARQANRDRKRLGRSRAQQRHRRRGSVCAPVAPLRTARCLGAPRGRWRWIGLQRQPQKDTAQRRPLPRRVRGASRVRKPLSRRSVYCHRPTR